MVNLPFVLAALGQGSGRFQNVPEACARLHANFGEVWRTHNAIFTTSCRTFTRVPAKVPTFTRVPVKVPSVCGLPSECAQKEECVAGTQKARGGCNCPFQKKPRTEGGDQVPRSVDARFAAALPFSVPEILQNPSIRNSGTFFSGSFGCTRRGSYSAKGRVSAF